MGLHKMAGIMQMTFWNAFSLKKNFEFPKILDLQIRNTQQSRNVFLIYSSLLLD